MKDLKSQASKNVATGKPGGLNAEIQSRIGHQIRKLDVPQSDPQVGGAGDKNDGGE